jgi:microcompartment protein CcmK/EutM
VGAGEGEVVMCVGGSSSRQTSLTDAKPVDLSIIAIIDSVELKGEKIFEKFKNERRPE